MTASSWDQHGYVYVLLSLRCHKQIWSLENRWENLQAPLVPPKLCLQNVHGAILLL